MYYTLSEEEFQKEAAPVLRKIFACEDPYNQPFASNVEARAILYPVSLTLDYTDTPLLEAIISTATKAGDSGFYLSIVERPPPKAQDKPYHWYFPFTEIKTYSSLDYPAILEHVLYSPNGRWGLMISHEDHALLGGTQVFFNTMREIIPGFDDINQIQDFLTDWKHYNKEHGADINWIPRLLTHVYDTKVVQHLLEETDFTGLL
jgi:hypothetical protein